MVVVLAAQAFDVQGRPRRHGQGAQHMADVFTGQAAEGLARKTELDIGVGPPRQVDDGARQGFIQGRVGRTEAGDSRPLAERLIDRRAEGQGAILGGVMIVDMEVALAAQGEVEAGVLGQGGQQVVEETDAGGDLGDAGAVEVKLERYIGFLGLA